MILIGSKAIKYWYPDFPREPRDTDQIVRQMPTIRDRGTEYLLNPVFDHAYDYPIMRPSDLYTLKISHLFWDIKWEKHMFDVQFLRKKGCVLNRELFDRLYAHWGQIHGANRRSDLEMTAANFFDNALKKYDHDHLHTLINPSPTYKKVLRDGAEVAVDEAKFNALCHQDKLNLVWEEVAVMAYERLAGRPWYIAYFWMLRKFIMHHAPMWEAIWIIEYYTELRKPFFNYKKHIDHEFQRVNESC